MVRLASGTHRLYLLLINSTAPTADELSVEVLAIERRRAGLEDDRTQWVILSEWNSDILERSYYLDHDAPKGRFTKAFFHRLLAELRPHFEAARVRTVGRVDQLPLPRRRRRSGKCPAAQIDD